MAFDLAATLRRLKPEKRVVPLTRRADSELPFVNDPVISGPGLLLDTTVYIDVLQGRAPQAVKDLLLAREVNHSRSLSPSWSTCSAGWIPRIEILPAFSRRSRQQSRRYVRTG